MDKQGDFTFLRSAKRRFRERAQKEEEAASKQQQLLPLLSSLIGAKRQTAHVRDTLI